MTSRDYQTDFYNLSPKVRDPESRLQQADKIAYILTEMSGYPLASAICLDVGCSSGIITKAVAGLCRNTFGVDYDEVAMRNIDRSALEVARFVRGDAMSLPVADGSIDVIICAQVYEHVPDDETLVAEIYRVLKPRGIVFFSGPNKLHPIEPHYFLPFLHWLPGRAADRYLRLLGKGDRYYERSRTLWGLRRLLAKFAIRDVSIEVLRWKLRRADASVWTRMMSRLPNAVWKLMLPVFPNYNWMLVKPAAGQDG